VSAVVTFHVGPWGEQCLDTFVHIAELLAKRPGKRVLAVDWSSRNVARHLEGFIVQQPPERPTGLLALFEARMRGEVADWRQFVCSLNRGSGHGLSLLPTHDPEHQRLIGFPWDRFYSDADGGRFLETLRDEWLATFDLVLIFCDLGAEDAPGMGAFAVQLPDVLILPCSTEAGAATRLLELTDRVHGARQRLAFDRTAVLVQPLLVPAPEQPLTEESLQQLADQLAPLYADWVPRTVPAWRVLAHSVLEASTREPSALEELTDIAQLLSVSTRRALEFSGALEVPTHREFIARLLGSEFRNVEALIPLHLKPLLKQLIQQSSEDRKTASPTEKDIKGLFKP
jgi:hypothetical protein